MADDIDDLLDEVETKFCVKTPVKNDGSRKITNNDISDVRKSHKKISPADVDLNSIIDDIIDSPEPLASLAKQESPNSSSRTRTHSLSQKRCSSVYLGGSSSPMGKSSAVSQRMCDQLRCTSCDFKIVFFDDFEWDTRCDYLFFRNNVPDFNKLKAKMGKKKGCRAYACQCMWRSVKTVCKVDRDSLLKWVCGKHTS